jgi:3-deoxy-D-manno-octulosonate 8-phosphate phosphatase (KDO 8-P phosphatase)
VKGDALESRLAERLRPVRLLVLDVDGTLTDNTVTVGDGGESLRFCVADGLAIKELQKAGVAVAWISGRGSPAAAARASELGVAELRLNTLAKAEAALEIARRRGITVSGTAAMGDDLPDLALRSACGFFAAPASARPEVLERADLVTSAAGGAGAVRELAELILRAQGRWTAIVGGWGG